VRSLSISLAKKMPFKCEEEKEEEEEEEEGLFKDSAVI